MSRLVKTQPKQNAMVTPLVHFFYSRFESAKYTSPEKLFLLRKIPATRCVQTTASPGSLRLRHAGGPSIGPRARTAPLFLSRLPATRQSSCFHYVVHVSHKTADNVLTTRTSHIKHVTSTMRSAHNPSFPLCLSPIADFTGVFMPGKG